MLWDLLLSYSESSKLSRKKKNFFLFTFDKTTIFPTLKKVFSIMCGEKMFPTTEKITWDSGQNARVLLVNNICRLLERRKQFIFQFRSFLFTITGQKIILWSYSDHPKSMKIWPQLSFMHAMKSHKKYFMRFLHLDFLVSFLIYMCTSFTEFLCLILDGLCMFFSSFSLSLKYLHAKYLQLFSLY